MDGIFGALQPAESAESAQWVFDALGRSDPYHVGRVIPKGFESYVALAHGHDPHEDDDLYSDLDAFRLGLLASRLHRSTGTPDRVWFCLWEGWGWLHADPESYGVWGARDDEARAAALAAAIEQYLPVDQAIEAFAARAPKVGNAERRYHLFSGPVTGAASFHTERMNRSEAPSLWWPDDRAWIVATEIYQPWTYVGAESAVVAAITEVWPHATRAVTLTNRNIWPELEG